MSVALLTLAEVAERSRLARQTLYNRIAQGKPPHPVRIGRRLRFHVAEVDRWLAVGDEGMRDAGGADRSDAGVGGAR